MRLDLFLYGWIDICGSSIYMYAVRFIFARFNLFFAVLILNERVSLCLCAFNIGRMRFEDFVRNGTPYSAKQMINTTKTEKQMNGCHEPY